MPEFELQIQSLIELGFTRDEAIYEVDTNLNELLSVD